MFKERDREAMHRRAQRAEAALERATYWFECVKHRGRLNNDLYLVAVADAALKVMKGDPYGPIS